MAWFEDWRMKRWTIVLEEIFVFRWPDPEVDQKLVVFSDLIRICTDSPDLPLKKYLLRGLTGLLVLEQSLIGNSD